jgi:2-polyprenyl-6-methoxyphenol hydroxylase-like FAD-dependent oxidoreductase
VEESSEWTSILNSTKDNSANYFKSLDGTPLSSTHYGMYMVTLNELKAILKVSAQAEQNGVVNKTSVESLAQDDDFRK